MLVPEVTTMTFIDMFDEECYAELYNMMEKAISNTCKKYNLDTNGVETWAIGFTHEEMNNKEEDDRMNDRMNEEKMNEEKKQEYWEKGDEMK